MEVGRPLSIRDRMFRMYIVYNPEKIPEIDTILAKFQGREQQVLETMISKYGPEPDEMRVQGALRRHRSENQQQQTNPQPIHSPQPDPDGFKRRIARLYRYYNPSKLKELDELFRKYPGQEPKILEQCIKKYGPEPTQQMLDSKIIQERGRPAASEAPPATGSVAPPPNQVRPPPSSEPKLLSKNPQERARPMSTNEPQTRASQSLPELVAPTQVNNPPSDEGKTTKDQQPKPSGRASLIQNLKVDSDSDDEGSHRPPGPPAMTKVEQKPQVIVADKSALSPSRRPRGSPEKSQKTELQKGNTSGVMVDEHSNSVSPSSGVQTSPKEKIDAQETPSEVKPVREVMNEKKPEASSHSKPEMSEKSKSTTGVGANHQLLMPANVVVRVNPELSGENPSRPVPHEATVPREAKRESEASTVPPTGKSSPVKKRREIGKQPTRTPRSPWVGTLERSRETSPPVKEPKRAGSSEQKHAAHVTPRRGTSPQQETPHSRLSPRVYVVDRRSFSPNIEQPPPLETVLGVPKNRIKSPVVFRRSATPVHHSNEGPREVVEVSSCGPRPLSSYSTFVIREAGKPSSWARCTTKAHPLFDVEEPGVVVEYIKEVPKGEAVKEQEALSKRLSRPRMYVPRKKGSA
jgi:hypothetical protein